MCASSSDPPDKLERFSLMRQTLAERLIDAATQTPTFPTWAAFDMRRIIEIRRAFDKEQAPPFDCFFLWGLKKCVPGHPLINSHCVVKEENSRRRYYYRHFGEEINVGIAMNVRMRSGENMLLVPVLKNIENMKFWEMVGTFKDLIERVRSLSYTLQDLSGGTITLNNVGALGDVDGGIPIINPPQSTLLGFGRVRKGVVIVGDEVGVRPMANVILVSDHRAYDGIDAARFLLDMRKFMEDFPQEDLA